MHPYAKQLNVYMYFGGEDDDLFERLFHARPGDELDPDCKWCKAKNGASDEKQTRGAKVNFSKLCRLCARITSFGLRQEFNEGDGFRYCFTCKVKKERTEFVYSIPDSGKSLAPRTCQDCLIKKYIKKVVGEGYNKQRYRDNSHICRVCSVDKKIFSYSITFFTSSEHHTLCDYFSPVCNRCYLTRNKEALPICRNELVYPYDNCNKNVQNTKKYYNCVCCTTNYDNDKYLTTEDNSFMCVKCMECMWDTRVGQYFECCTFGHWKDKRVYYTGCKECPKSTDDIDDLVEGINSAHESDNEPEMRKLAYKLYEALYVDERVVL